jgi:PPM family protein phosphatase
VYAAGPGGVRQLSTDDRLSGDDLPPGIVTQAIGGTDGVTAVDPHLITSPLSDDTSYLICTDGLTDPVPADVLGEVLRDHGDGRAVFELWRAAVEAGGPDNITIALVRAGAETSAVWAAAKRLATPSQHAGPPGPIAEIVIARNSEGSARKPVRQNG